MIVSERGVPEVGSDEWEELGDGLYAGGDAGLGAARMGLYVGGGRAGCSSSEGEGEEGGGDWVRGYVVVVRDEVLVFAMLSGIEAVDVAAEELVKTRLMVLIGLKLKDTVLGAGAGVSALAL
jgi:hypothetical protein